MDRAAPIQGLRDISSGGGGILQRYADLGQGNIFGAPEFAEVNAPAYSAGSSATVLAGQLTTSTTAAPIEAVGAGHVCAEVYVQNDPASTVSIRVGSALAQDKLTLAPGAGAWFPAFNTEQVVAVAASGTPKLNWLARAASGGAVNSMNTTGTALATITCLETVIQADPANTVNILVGDATQQRVSLAPGQVFRVFTANANVIYLKAASVTTGVDAYYQCRTKM